MKDDQVDLTLLAGAVFCTEADQFTREAALFFLENEPLFRGLAASQWGSIETILLRAGPETENTLAKHLRHQHQKAAAREEIRAAAAYSKLHGIPAKLQQIIHELFAKLVPACLAHWGEAFSEQQFAEELNRAALRHFWFSLCRLARMYEKDALPPAILEDFRQCLHN